MCESMPWLIFVTPSLVERAFSSPEPPRFGQRADDDLAQIRW